jgi:hypothetical protein
VCTVPLITGLVQQGSLIRRRVAMLSVAAQLLFALPPTTLFIFATTVPARYQHLHCECIMVPSASGHQTQITGSYEKVLTPLDILTFYIWDRFFTENFADFTIFIFIFKLITCMRTISQSTDVQHITYLYQIAYVQRIRCIKNSP